MVPKPDVEWVKKALEKLNIRVVNDRPGRRRKDEVLEKQRLNQSNQMQGSNLMGDDQAYLSQQMGRSSQSDSSGVFSPAQQGFPPGLPSSNDNIMQSMNSMNSFGMTAMGGNSGSMSGGGPGNMNRRFSNEGVPGMSSLNAMPMKNSNFDNNNMGMSPFPQGRMSLDFPLGPGGQLPGMDSPASSRQHFGVLKAHHDNLTKELKQTQYMMQMYQRNYTEQTDQQQQAVNNFMNSSGYGSTGGSMGGQMRDPYALRQDQGRQNQGYNNSMQYPYDVPDRRNSFGMGDVSLSSQRSSMHNAYMAGPGGNSGLPAGNPGLQGGMHNHPTSGYDNRLPHYAGYSPSHHMQTQNMQSHQGGSQQSSGDRNKRQKIDHTSGEESVSESAPGVKREEI